MVDINVIKFYGWWYRCCENKYDHNWWYSEFDGQIYSVEELFEKFSFKSYDDIVNSSGYIPLWKTDEYAVIESFLREMNNKDADKYLESKKDAKWLSGFEYYIESHNDYICTWWHEYSDKKVVSDAIKWCRENGIAYKK